MHLVDNERDILLAEDDKEDVLIFDMALQELKFPYILRSANNGDVLFVLLKERIPYILFLDVDMPCKDGVACISEIRKNKDYDNLPIVMYTSHFAEKVVDDAFRSGANLYITKDATLEQLVGKLKKVFSLDWKDYLHYPAKNKFVLE